MPSELIPVGARTVVRALTRAAAQVGPDWVWPYWLERQNDPTSPSFVPRGHLPFLTNVTHRNWTAVGNLDLSARRSSTRAGWCTPWRTAGRSTGGSVPTTGGTCRREVAVRQPARRLARGRDGDGHPFGDAVQRVRRPAQQRRGGGEMVVVEIENASPVPVAPWRWPSGRTTPRAWRWSSASTCAGPPWRWTAGGAAAAPPAPRIAASTFRDGDSAATVLAGDAAERWRAPVRDPAGLAQAAVYPLAHGATFRAAIPLDPGPRAPSRGRPPPARGGAAVPGGPPARMAAGWQAQATAACASCCPTTASPRPSPPTAASSSCCTTASRSRPARPPTTGSGSAIPPTCWRRSTSTATTRRRPGPRLVPRSAAWRRVLLQPGQRVGQQRRRPRRPGPPLAPGARHPVRRGDRRTDRPRRPLDRPQAAVVRGPQGRRCPLAGLLPPGCPPSTSARWTTTTGTTSGRGGAAGAAEAAARRPTRRRRRRGGVRLRHVGRRRGVTGADRGPTRHRRHPRGPPAAHRRGRHGVARRPRRSTCWRPTTRASRRRRTPCATGSCSPTGAPSSRASATAGSAPI